MMGLDPSDIPPIWPKSDLKRKYEHVTGVTTVQGYRCVLCWCCCCWLSGLVPSEQHERSSFWAPTFPCLHAAFSRAHYFFLTITDLCSWCCGSLVSRQDIAVAPCWFFSVRASTRVSADVLACSAAIATSRGINFVFFREMPTVLPCPWWAVMFIVLSSHYEMTFSMALEPPTLSHFQSLFCVSVQVSSSFRLSAD